MNEIIESIYKSHMPKIKVEIGMFRHRDTGEMAFCVMSVNTTICERVHHYVYNASLWERVNNFQLEGVDRIEKCFHEDMIKKIEKSYEDDKI